MITIEFEADVISDVEFESDIVLDFDVYNDYIEAVEDDGGEIINRNQLQRVVNYYYDVDMNFTVGRIEFEADTL